MFSFSHFSPCLFKLQFYSVHPLTIIMRTLFLKINFFVYISSPLFANSHFFWDLIFVVWKSKYVPRSNTELKFTFIPVPLTFSYPFYSFIPYSCPWYPPTPSSHLFCYTILHWLFALNPLFCIYSAHPVFFFFLISFIQHFQVFMLPRLATCPLTSKFPLAHFTQK